MAVYTDENVTIGTVNPADDTNFVPDTRIWAGGFRQNGAVTTWAEANSYGTGDLVRIVNGATFIFRANKNINVGTAFSLADWDPLGDLFNVSEVIRSQGSSIVTATGCTITVQGGANDAGLWTHGGANQTGTYNFTDVLITSHANGVNASTNNNLIFNNVTWVTTGLLGQATFGSWHGGTARNFDINGFNIWFNAINTNQATGVFFPGNVTGDLNGISLWNGVIGDDILGAALTFNNKIFSNLQSGPIGYVPPTGDGGRIPTTHRALYRCASTGANVGMLLGYDYRGLHGQAGNYVFGADNNGHHWIINPLQGTPTGSLSFANAFQSTTPSNVVVAIGNRPTTTAGDVKAVLASTGSSFYRAPAAFTPSTPPTIEATEIIDLATAPNGVLISNQIHTIAVGGFTATAVDTVDPRSYRTYSFQQQDWGTLRGVATPAPSAINDASNTLVEQVRMSGNYPDVTGDGFTTALDINEAADPITANFATHAAAVAGLHGTGRATTGRDAVASVKAVQYDDITTTLVPLVYTRTGTAVDFGTKDLVFQDVNGTPVPGGLTITIPASSLDLDPLSSVSSIQGKEIRVNGDILNNDEDKVELIGTDEVRLANLTAQNAIADAPTIVINGTGTHSGADFTATTLTVSAGTLTEGNAFTAKTGTTMFVSFTGLIANRTYSPEELLGDAYDITDLDTVTISSSVAIRVQTNDAQVLGDGINVIKEPIIIRHGIRPEGTLAEVQAAGGFFDVINMATGVSVLTPPGPVNCATITDFDAVTALKVDGDATVWKSYYKPLNVFGPAWNR